MPSSLIFALLLSAAAQQEPSSDLFVYREPAPADKAYLRPVILERERGDDWATDYPAAAQAAGEGGKVHLSVVVDAQDRIASCAIFKSDAPARINAAACAILKRRGKLRHALSMSGQPVAATAAFEMVFEPKRVRRVPMVTPLPGIVRSGALHDETNLEFAAEPDWSSVLPTSRAARGEVAISLHVYRAGNGKDDRYCAVERGDAAVGEAACALLKERASVRLAAGQEPGRYGDTLQLLLQWDRGTMRYERPTVREGRDVEIVEWHIPWKSDAPAPDPGWAAVVLGADGKVRSCQVTASTGQDAADVAACLYWRTEARFTPPLDIFGRTFDVPTNVHLVFDR